MNIDKVNIQKLLPIVFDDNIIINKDLSLTLSDKINKDILSFLKKGPFGLLMKDLKKLLYKNQSQDYIFINNNNNKILCKIIDKNDLDNYINFNINKVKDIYYIIIKNEQNITTSLSLIEEENLNIYDPTLLNPVNLQIEDDSINHISSISLFND